MLPGGIDCCRVVELERTFFDYSIIIFDDLNMQSTIFVNDYLFAKLLLTEACVGAIALIIVEFFQNVLIHSW